MNKLSLVNRRVLVIDDNEAIHADFKKILGNESPSIGQLDAAEASLFGAEVPTSMDGIRVPFEIESAFQGEDGWRKVRDNQDQPFSVAFVDMRMPPGWDGVETIQHCWEVDPNLQVVICTAYSDYSWNEIISRLGDSDRLLLLKKPFDPAEVWQMACALSAKWAATREANKKLQDSHRLTTELQNVNDTLKEEVSQRRNVESKLWHQVYHDALTGLPNRLYLAQYLDKCIAKKREDPTHLFALLFIDLDNFKLINDSYGHDFGDDLLIQVSQRLRICLRSDDVLMRCQDDEAARLGGDEFVVILSGMSASGDAAIIAERVLAQLTTPFEVRGRQITTGASVGITTSQESYVTADEVLRDADTAMYRAKALGRCQFAVFEPSMLTRARARLERENDLRTALAEDQFCLAYQPIIRIKDGQLRGFEALVRWQHPLLDMIPPKEFIAIAEESGMIIPLGRIILEKAVRQLTAWRKELPAAKDLSMGINLSRRQVLEPGLPDLVEMTLREARLPASAVALELTETAMIEDFSIVAAQLRALKQIGVEIHMDDFGTGYSSLSCLHRFPLDIVKIDREFTATMAANPEFAATIRAITTLAHNLGMRVIVEGVETHEQLAQVTAIGCDFVQGYLFAPPLTPDAAFEIIRCGALLPSENVVP